MKNFLSIIFLFSFLISQASHHPRGQEITYKHLGGLDYEITYKQYLQCASVLFLSDTARFIQVKSSCSTPISFYIYLEQGYPKSLTLACPDQCASLYSDGTLEYKFSGIYTLPIVCADWEFSIEECCRNSFYTTLSPSVPFGSDMFSSARLNNLHSENNSIVFLKDPEYLSCVGEQICFDPGAFDIDGDSLSFAMIPVNMGENIALDYSSGYSYVQPLTTIGPMQFNTATGNLCFTPLNSEFSLWNLRVYDFRNGEPIGYIEREMEIISHVCPNNTPQLSGLDLSTDYTANVYAGQNYCFAIQSSDMDQGDSTFIRWNNLPMGMNVNVNHSKNESGSICWTPGIQDVGIVPICFDIDVKDNSCPYTKTYSQQYCLRVLLPVGISNYTSSHLLFHLFPNPSQGNFNIEIENYQRSCVLSLEDLTGRVLLEMTINKMANISTQNFSSGIYLVKLKDDEGRTFIQKMQINSLR